MHRRMKKFLRRESGWVTAFAICFCSFLFMLYAVMIGNFFDAFDRRSVINLAALRTPSINAFLIDLSSLGAPAVTGTLTLITLILLALKKKTSDFYFLLIVEMGVLIGSPLLKHWVGRVRPLVELRLIDVTGLSFPSGHAYGASTYYLSVTFIAWNYYQDRISRLCILTCACMIIFSVCYTRVYLGVHYPSDVVAGVFFGASWVLLIKLLFRASAFENV